MEWLSDARWNRHHWLDGDPLGTSSYLHLFLCGGIPGNRKRASRLYDKSFAHVLHRVGSTQDTERAIFLIETELQQATLRAEENTNPPTPPAEHIIQMQASRVKSHWQRQHARVAAVRHLLHQGRLVATLTAQKAFHGKLVLFVYAHSTCASRGCCVDMPLCGVLGNKQLIRQTRGCCRIPTQGPRLLDQGKLPITLPIPGEVSSRTNASDQTSGPSIHRGHYRAMLRVGGCMALSGSSACAWSNDYLNESLSATRVYTDR